MSQHNSIDERSYDVNVGCPFCGGTTEIYSYYRDGGSTLYHQPCGRDKTWKNPNFVKRRADWDRLSRTLYGDWAPDAD